MVTWYPILTLDSKDCWKILQAQDPQGKGFQESTTEGADKTWIGHWIKRRQSVLENVLKRQN